MKKILVVSWIPFYKWSYKRIDLDKLQKKFKIIIYDVSRLCFKNFNIEKIYKKKDLIKTTKFSNLKIFCKEIRKLKIDIIINMTGVRESHPIYAELKNKNVKIVKFTDKRDSWVFHYPYKFLYFYKYLLKKVFHSKKKNNKEISIVSGSNYMNDFHSLNCKMIPSHSINYNYFLRKNETPIKKKKKKIISYIDQGFGFHPDFLLNNKINKKFYIAKYVKKINFLFSFFKKKGYEVYFLSSPKIDKKKQSIYKNCKKIYYKTYEYIKISDLVICSTSSTIDYPIVLKKKILRIFSSEFKSYPIVNKCYEYDSKFFSNPGLNLDDINNLTEEKINNLSMFPSEKYKEYFSKFIRHPDSKNHTFFKIITNLVK